MEDNLLDIQSPEEVADHVNMSQVYLQRGFQVMTGYSLGEYIRNRRLYLAAVDLIGSDEQIIDIAYKYGYDTPASFDKAFSRFHGATPMDVRKSRSNIRSFLRLQIRISVQGGNSMNFRIEKKDAFNVVGFQRIFDSENSMEMIPKYWDEMIEKHASHLMKGQAPEGMMEEYVASHRVGEFGVCIDDFGGGKFNYMIAGYYKDDEIPEGMVVRRIDAEDWAVFDCTMATLQDTYKTIWNEWMPANNEYESKGIYDIEWYSPEGTPGPDQKCEIWIPVKRK